VILDSIYHATVTPTARSESHARAEQVEKSRPPINVCYWHFSTDCAVRSNVCKRVIKRHSAHIVKLSKITEAGKVGILQLAFANGIYDHQHSISL
jgi:hypothetical protein